MHLITSLRDDFSVCGVDIRRGGGSTNPRHTTCDRCKKSSAWRGALYKHAHSPSATKERPAPKRIKPHGKTYQQLLINLLSGYCPAPHPCKTCGGPVLTGYTCGRCGDSLPMGKTS